MPKKLLLLVALLCLLPTSVAVANPTGATFTQDATRVTVGTAVHYHGTYAVCDYPPCREQIVAFGSGFSRTGTVLKEGNDLSYVWGKTGTFILQYRVTNGRGTNGRVAVDAATVVSAP